MIPIRGKNIILMKKEVFDMAQSEDDETLQENTPHSCCSNKKKERTPEEYKALMNRLNRIEGQIKGIKKMLENDAYCPDILIQVSAATAALNSFSKLLLANHIHTCVVDDIKEGKEGVVDELCNVLQKMMK